MEDCPDFANGLGGFNLAPNGGAFPDTCSGRKSRYVRFPEWAPNGPLPADAYLKLDLLSRRRNFLGLSVKGE